MWRHLRVSMSTPVNARHSSCGQERPGEFSGRVGRDQGVVHIVAVFLSSSSVHAASDGCAQAPPPVAACHAVHGRLNAYNGRRGAVIWVVGSRHLMGVLDDKNGDLLVPDNDVLDRDDEVYGDFTVCALARPQIGHVEEICVQSARRLVVKYVEGQPLVPPAASALR